MIHTISVFLGLKLFDILILLQGLIVVNICSIFNKLIECVWLVTLTYLRKID